MREGKRLEFKQTIHSSTYMKTISAFANYEGGEIIFGVTDEGETVGIENPGEACLDLENKINDSMNPVPEYELNIGKDKTVHLTVYPGMDKPYLYKGKAYRRNDSATVEVGRMEYNRLILAGREQSFEELPARQQELTFTKLEQELIRVMGISEMSMDVIKTLELYSDKRGFNKAAELLADKNSFPGVDVVRFGDSIDEIMERVCFEHISVISQLEESLHIFHRYYRYERIEGAERKTVDKIPEKAFREALANALVHRSWDVKASVRISMYTDRVEISSPGGLPEGIGEEEYLEGQISLLRNPILGNVFFRLKYMERFGTGIRRINYAYADSLLKPEYKVSPNAIQVILPVTMQDFHFAEEEKRILELLEANGKMSRAEIAEAARVGKDKGIRLLNGLLEKKVIKRSGAGRGVRYEKK